jgi:peptidyl-prolyl cis-trans isomerase B (cyclophilin B)
VNSGFYNKYNMKFHRVVPGFVVQTGDPTGTGAGGSKKTIPLEAKNKLSHNAKGIVAMARGFDPNSATSQFYITLAPQPSLDGKYAIFGKVISGLSVLDKIELGDMLYGIRLVDINSITRDPVEKKGFFSSLF